MTIGDIAIKARNLVDADSTSYTNANLLIELNLAYEETVIFILGIDGLWQFDDSRYTTFPRGKTTLVDGQSDYSFDSAMLEIERVQVLDSSGNWQLLDPIDKSSIPFAVEEYQKTKGLPNEYDKEGSSLILYPAPSASNVTLASGLEVFFQRTASTFSSAELTTGTATPGFASPFHGILAYKTALPYALTYKKDRVGLIVSEIARITKGIEEFYGRREKDRRKVMTMSRISHR